MIRAALLAAAMLLALPHPARANPADEAAITAHGETWSRLYGAGRIDDMRPLYETDAWLMTHGAPAARGVDAILAYLAASKARAGEVSFAFAPEQIVIDGDYGFLTSKYWMTINPRSASPARVAGRSFLVFKRGTDGQWRIWRDIDNQAPDVTVE